MGATFTGIGVTPEGVDIIQVGDSRAYLVRNGKIYQITKDQSLVQQLIDAQQISAEEAETHTLKERDPAGTRCSERDLSGFRPASLRAGMMFFCSAATALSNKVSGREMQKIVLDNFDQLENACAELVKEANENGGEDNITVILAKFTGDGLSETEAEMVSSSN